MGKLYKTRDGFEFCQWSQVGELVFKSLYSIFPKGLHFIEPAECALGESRNTCRCNSTAGRI